VCLCIRAVMPHELDDCMPNGRDNGCYIYVILGIRI
jgi:hypothetical protein